MDRQTERELLIACILGDGCLVQHKQQGTTWLKLAHSPVQRDYLLWKTALIESTRLVRGRRFTLRDKVNHHSNGKAYPVCTANMYGLKYFRILRKWLYPNGIKTPTRILKYLRTALSLAIFTMDDGCVEKRKKYHKDGSVYFASPRISLALFQPETESLEFLAWMATAFGIQGYTTLRQRRDVAKPPYYVLMCNAENSKILWSAIAPFVQQIPSMHQKFHFCIERWGWPSSTTATGVARVPSNCSVAVS